MNRPIALAAGALVTLAAGTVVATTAAATGTTTTLKVTGTELSHTQFSTTTESEADLLHLPNTSISNKGALGKKAGYATESCVAGPSSDVCAVAIALKRGILFGRYAFPISGGIASSFAHGKILGGLNAYKNATGTITLRTHPATPDSPATGSWVITYTLP